MKIVTYNFTTSAGFTGKIVLTNIEGRIWSDYLQTWTNLQNILFDSNTNTLSFERQTLNGIQRWTGVISGDQISGTVNGSTWGGKEVRLMAWSEGRHFVSSIQFEGKTYNIYVFRGLQIPMIWDIEVCKGDWQVANPDNIAGYLIEDSVGMGVTPTKTPENTVLEAINMLNQKMKNYFGPVTPVTPVTWSENVEALIQSLMLFLKDGIPQVK